MQIRSATSADAGHMAFLINLAGDGVPEYLWSGMAEGDQTGLEVGEQRAAAQQGSFSHGSTRLACDGDTVLGMLVAYRIDDPYEMGDLNEYPEVVRPLIELEALAPGSWYINAIATYEQHRGKGVGTALMAETEAAAREAGCTNLSLIVADQNTTASRLYRHLGFAATASRPVVPFPGGHLAGDWELMLKPLD